FTRFVGGVVGVSVRIEAIEGAPVVAIERQTELDALGQVRIRDELGQGTPLGHSARRRLKGGITTRCLSVIAPTWTGTKSLLWARVHLRFSLGKRQAPAYSVMLGAAPVTVS